MNAGKQGRGRLAPHGRAIMRAAIEKPVLRSPWAQADNARHGNQMAEDFVSPAETRSFSRSAQLRHVTQPAFSRRIQALEAWAGTDLVDRSSHPTRLHRRRHHAVRPGAGGAAGAGRTRAMLRGIPAAARHGRVRRAAHAGLHLLPAWVSAVRADFGPLKSRLIALNVHDAVMRLVEGGCDLLDLLPPPIAAAAARPPSATTW